MLALDFIRQHLDLVRRALLNRRTDLTLDSFTELDATRRRLIAEVEQRRAALNRVSPQIGALLKAGQQDEAEAKRAEMRELKASIEALEAERESVEQRLQELVRIIPNVPHESVPVGDESANQEVARWGEPRHFDFPRTTSNLARRSVFWTWNALPRCQARALPSSRGWEPNWNGRSSASCSTCT